MNSNRTSTVLHRAEFQDGMGGGGRQLGCWHLDGLMELVRHEREVPRGGVHSDLWLGGGNLFTFV
jgi:hypothetical protein